MSEPVKRYIMYPGVDAEKAMPGCGTEVITASDHERAMAEKDDKAFSVLAVYGVPKERAKSVANGIEVLATRYERELASLKARCEVIDPKVPETCATCGDSAKVSVHFRPKRHIGWYCAHDPYGDNLKESRVPCARVKLPIPPKWCPRRKAK